MLGAELRDRDVPLLRRRREQHGARFGAGFAELWPNLAALLVIAAILVAGSTRAFRKTIS